MASKIQFPAPKYSPFTDGNGQVWEWNDVAWVRKGVPPGIGEAPDDSQQYARINPADDYTDPENPIINEGYWALVSADTWYLGSFGEPPLLDNFGVELRVGQTYYNYNTATVYVWDGGEWDAFSGVSEIATLAEFRWDSLNLTAGVPLDVKAGDEHGNIPVDQWLLGQIIITCYKDTGNGLTRLVEKRPSDGTYQGTHSFVGDTGPFPGEGTADMWDWWVVAGAGSYDGQTFADGDVIQAITDNPSTVVYETFWTRHDPGFGLDAFDYTVEYDPNPEGTTGRTVTFTDDIVDTERLVIETGTLAASEYIKISMKNACPWEFVECGTLDPTDTAKLPVQKTVADYVKAQIAESQALATNALIGSTFSYAGTTPPPNALSCDGQNVSKSEYPILWARLGTTWNNFNGATTPAEGTFRVPPQEANGFPLHYAGTSGAENVGTFLPSNNKSHSHGSTHSHTGTVSSATGAHTHTVYFKTDGGIRLGGGKTMTNVLITEAQYNAGKASGSIHYFKTTSGGASTGTTGNNVVISDSNAGTALQGGPVARPNTAILKTCIWADIQP